MEKYILRIVILSILMISGGVEKGEEIVEKNEITEQIQEEALSDNIFFSQEDTYYEMIYSEDEGYVTEKTKLSMLQVAVFERGIVYEMNIDSEIQISRFEENRFPIYLYVTNDKIYRLRKDKEEIGTIVKEEVLISDASIVCQNEEITDCLTEDERGWHEYIEVNGKQRVFHSYNNLVETGFYEVFIWEEGNGLVEYRSGYGACADAVQLTKIETYGEEYNKVEESYEAENEDVYRMFYGTWKFTEVVSEHLRLGGDEGYESLLGEKVTYLPDYFACKGYGEVIEVIENPKYQIYIFPVQEGYNQFWVEQTGIEKLLPEAQLFVYVTIGDRPPSKGRYGYCGTEFIVKDESTMFVYDYNCIYKLERVSYMEGHEEGEFISWVEAWT